MYRKILITLMAFMLTFSLLPFGALAQGESVEVVREFSNITFDSGSINASNFLNYANLAKNGYGLSVVKDSETNDNVLMIKQKKDATLSNGSGVQLSCPGSNLSTVKIGGKFVLEYDIKFENFNSTCRLYIIEFVNGNTWYSGPAVNTSGELVLNDGNNTVVTTVSPDTWYTFKCVVDVNEEKCYTYFEGDVIQQSDVTGQTSGGFKYATLPRCTGLSQTLDSIIYMDNIRLYNIPDKYTFESFTKTDDGENAELDNFPLGGASLKIKFSEEMQQEISKEDFIFLSDGQKIDFDLVYDKENCEVYITPQKEFKGREKCTVSFETLKTALGTGARDGALVEFTTAPPIYGIAEVSTPDFVSGTDANVEVQIKNHTDASKEGVVLIGFYKQGRLITVSTIDVNAPGNYDEYTQANLDITVPEDYTMDNYELRAFLMKKNSFFIVDVITV